jgi:trigger factor
VNHRLGKKRKKKLQQQSPQAKREGRPAIPEKIKRAVRQRCRFGCVICGIPLFHYDHIEEYADVQEHKAENLTLLCPNHHQSKTSNRLSKDLLLKRNAKPFNEGHGLTAKSAVSLVSAGNVAKFFAGGNTFLFPIVPRQLFPCITIDGEVVAGLTVEDGALLLDLKLHDATGATSMLSERGEVAISTGNRDYRLEGETLSIRSAPANIIVELEYFADGFWLKRGQFFGANGVELTIHETELIAITAAGARTSHAFSLFMGGGITVDQNQISFGSY